MRLLLSLLLLTTVAAAELPADLTAGGDTSKEVTSIAPYRQVAQKALGGKIWIHYGGRGRFPRDEFPHWDKHTGEYDQFLTELVKGLNLRPGQIKRVKLVEVPDETPD